MINYFKSLQLDAAGFLSDIFSLSRRNLFVWTNNSKYAKNQKKTPDRSRSGVFLLF